MAGAQILFHPSCSSDDVEAVHWKRVSGRAQQPAGPTTKIFHCVANTVGQSPDGRQTSSGQSFIREPSGLPLVEAGYYQEEMVTAVLHLDRADRCYALESVEHPAFLKRYWQMMIRQVRTRADDKPE
jgi:predicted amidohydrolase